MRQLHLLFIVTLLLSYLHGQKNYEGELLNDIDYDGKLEMVQWNKFTATDLGEYFQLRVIDDDGEAIWIGPKVQNCQHPFVFCAMDFGISLPEIFEDIDMDGNFELLAPEPQNDVSPTFYKRLKWINSSFQALPSAALMASSSNIESFKWRKSIKNDTIWISQLTKQIDGKIKADIIQYSGSANAQTASAIIKFDPKGAYIVQWIKKLKYKNSFKNQVPTHSYKALLSNQDHYNSHGERLYSIANIIQQDRSNFYKGKGDSSDTGNSFFSTFKARSLIRIYKIIPLNCSYTKLKKTIVHSNPFIKVDIKPPYLYIKVIRF